MSYSHKVKSELMKLPAKSGNEIFAELAAIFRFAGTFSGQADETFFTVRSENPAFARRIFSLAKQYYSVSSAVDSTENRRFRQHNDYTVGTGDSELLRDITENMEIGFSNGTQYYFALPGQASQNEDTVRAYIRGAFLASGSISNPEKTYHLEIKARDPLLARELTGMLETCGLKPKTIPRGSSRVVYIKEGGDICEFLAITGAHDALMEFENIRIMKDMRNSVNRLVNCETSNMDKSVSAGVRQAEDIRLIESTEGLASLPPTLAEIARIRLENEDISYTELSQLTKKKIGKSGVSHRLRKIAEIAEEIRRKQIAGDCDQKSGCIQC